MDLNKVIKDLKRGNNIEKNLSVYGNAMARSYLNMASYMLAMDLAANYDLIEADDSEVSAHIKTLFKTVVEVLEKVIVDEDLSELPACIHSVYAVRDAVLQKTKALDDYTYVLQIYEHLLNRAEYRFKAYEDDTDLEAFRDDVLRFVAAGSSAEIVNDRIRMVMSELPVRLTTAKFMDMMGACSSYYKGVRNDIAGGYFDRIKACARSLSEDDLDPSWTMLYETCRMMLSLDMDAMTEETWTKAMAALDSTGKYIAGNLASCLRLIDIVNHLAVVLLSMPYVPVPGADTQKAFTVIREVLRAEKEGVFLHPDEDIVGLLSALTDRQSVYQGEHMMLEDTLYEVLGTYKAAIDQFAAGDLYRALHACLQLSAPAALSEIHDASVYFSVDQTWIDQKTMAVAQHFQAVFEQMQRPFRRAVMALTFGCLPVIFDRLNDFGDYVVQSLENCRDGAERAACMRIIREIIAGA